MQLFLPENRLECWSGRFQMQVVTDIDTLLKNADCAMYRAKGLGKRRAYAATAGTMGPAYPTDAMTQLALAPCEGGRIKYRRADSVDESTPLSVAVKTGPGGVLQARVFNANLTHRTPPA